MSAAKQKWQLRADVRVKHDTKHNNWTAEEQH